MNEIFEEARKPSERESVIFLLPDSNNRILAELRVKQGSGYRGRYRVPGGEIEDGEEPAQAAFREVFEEFGVVAEHLIFLDTFEEVTLNNKLVRLHAFLIRDYRGEPREMEPNKSRLFWFTMNEAWQKLKLSSSRLVLEKAEKFLV